MDFSRKMATKPDSLREKDLANSDSNSGNEAMRSSTDITTTREVASVPLAAAIRKQKPSLWTKSMLKLYLCLAVAACTACANGFNGPVMGNINGQKQYRDFFNFDPENGTPYNGLPFSMAPIGNAVGSFLIGPVHDQLGRKWGMCLGSLLILVFAAVQASSQNLAQFMVARFFLGMGGALAVTGGAIYTTEISPPQSRGALTGLYNCYYYVGAIPSYWVSYGTARLATNLSWRIPLYLQMVFAGLATIGSVFLPESPRWLIANGRHEQAIDIMVSTPLPVSVTYLPARLDTTATAIVILLSYSSNIVR